MDQGSFRGQRQRVHSPVDEFHPRSNLMAGAEGFEVRHLIDFHSRRSAI